MFKLITTTLLLSFLFASELCAEPWIDSRDIWMRADIELLSDAGIIKVPVSTYPLMWSGIIEDIDHSDITNIPLELKKVYWRVKKAGKIAMSKRNTRQLRVSLSNKIKPQRSLGDLSKDKVEWSARNFGLSKSFAWNLEVTNVNEPLYGDEIRFDGSYFAFVWGNWVASIGAIEKWWGNSWDYSHSFSEYSPPPLGINVQRNYSSPTDSPILSWLGLWGVNFFVSNLEGQRRISESKVVGVSLTAKPSQFVEFGLRGINLTGSERGFQNQNISVDKINCYKYIYTNTDCHLALDVYDEKLGIDIRWRVPVKYPFTIYAGYFEEDRDLSRSQNELKLFGISSSFYKSEVNWKWFVEYNGSALLNAEPSVDESTIGLIEEQYLRTSYKNDTSIISFSILGQLNNKHSMHFKAQYMKFRDMHKRKFLINTMPTNNYKNEIFKTNRFQVSWRYRVNKANEFKVQFDYDYAGRNNFVGESRDKYRLSLDWVYGLNE